MWCAASNRYWARTTINAVVQTPAVRIMIGWAGFLANMISMLDTMDGNPFIAHRPIMPSLRM